MITTNTSSRISTRAALLMVCALAFGVAGCSGKDGSTGAAGTPGPGVANLADATALNFTITSVSIASHPVVNFSVTNQDGVAVAGFAETDLRFNIAKLIPGAPTKWQNYIYRNQTSSAHQGSQERKTTSAGYRFGTLVDHKDGTFTYTFATDITNPADVVCPSPCTDVDGVALDLSYQPTLTHRVGIQQSNSALPKANAIYDFVPAGAAVSTTRDIVKTAKCNECHNQLAAHGSRIETKLCVTCHNPGSWVAGTPGTPVDFKVMIHKIHRSENLPSVKAGTPYMIGTANFSEIAFPQDIRNCAKCHDGTVGASNATAQGDNWINQPSKAACGSCHDDYFFGAGTDGVAPDPAKPYQTKSHVALSAVWNPSNPAPENPDDSTCVTCHVPGQAGNKALGLAPGADKAHAIPSKLARGKFQFNIEKICGVSVAANGTADTSAVAACQAGGYPTVTLSVSDPSGATTHGYGNKYNLYADPEFWDTGTAKAIASMTVDIAWDTRDYNNTGGSQARPARANQFSVFGATTSTPYGQPAGFTTIAATNNGDGTFTLTAATPLPDGSVWPNVAAARTGTVAIEGRACNTTATDVAGVALPCSNSVTRVPIKGAVAYFGISTAPSARRVAVDATTKCDACHDQLSLHGGGRNDNVQLCVLCHNPNNTDAQASARTKYPNHLTQISALDGKKEESIDLKRMIHGIHAGAKKSLDGLTTLEGFREKGIAVSGTDFSGVRFPGILNDCSACHTSTGYQLTGLWETPTQTGNILGSTIDSTPGLTSLDTSATVDAALQDPSTDLKISPIAAVCSSCHDGDLPKQHMLLNGATFGATQGQISSTYYETCSVCHGPGRTADVKVVHGVK